MPSSQLSSSPSAAPPALEAAGSSWSPLPREMTAAGRSSTLWAPARRQRPRTGVSVHPPRCSCALRTCRQRRRWCGFGRPCSAAPATRATLPRAGRHKGHRARGLGARRKRRPQRAWRKMPQPRPPCSPPAQAQPHLLGPAAASGRAGRPQPRRRQGEPTESQRRCQHRRCWRRWWRVVAWAAANSHQCPAAASRGAPAGCGGTLPRRGGGGPSGGKGRGPWLGSGRCPGGT
mmetsp:Transcript_9222/g.21919  ORF Transcript_9222/g.21919 Transcript_9222/m.21919 type:complete len:232 (+) Transcript_9222:823-1518(+)